VLFWSLDRFSREGVGRTFRYLEQLQAAGVTWQNCRDPQTSGTVPSADLFIATSALWAKVEREQISARTKAALDRDGPRKTARQTAGGSRQESHREAP
jgi:DNA invertase Pin-like site-specific DNA recombinase